VDGFAVATLDRAGPAPEIGLHQRRDLLAGHGVYLVNVNGRDVARGEFEEVTPNSRLVYSFGWEDSTMGVPPGATRVQIDLASKDRGTLLSFVHSGLPEPAIGPHTDGWMHYLGRLAIVAAGGDPGPDPRLNRDDCA
jgi:uncharacterized protein YndB with AHSA1/START domain